MSTSNVTFQLGEAASASKAMTAFSGLWNQGDALLKTLVSYRNLSLTNFQQKVEALNGRRQRANRIVPSFTAVRFVITDFLDIDQTLTSATVRADSQAVTLKERSTTTNAVVLNQTFSTSYGTAEAISTDNSLYRVQDTLGTIPVGTFSLQLQQALQMTVLTFDLAAMPPVPVFMVSASPDGVTYTPATRVSMNGYRLTAWFPPMAMLYVSLAITPAAPDTLGGTSYTFGLTDFVGAETEFEMSSELVSLPLTFAPVGTQLQLVAQADPNILYFLSFNGSPWQETVAGSVVSIPGTTASQFAGVGMNTAGLLAVTLPTNVYPNSIAVVETTGKPVNLVAGLSPTDANIPALLNDYVSIVPGTSPALQYISSNLTAALAKTFTVSCASGPATSSVQLRVQLTTSDRTVTPSFTGASLQEL
jgi:hypothetical protein